MPRPLSPNSIGLQVQDGLAIAFDVDAFDEAIRSQGVGMVHHVAMRCPVGMSDRFDSRRTHEDHSGCSNGFLYTAAGAITCLFTGAPKNQDRTELGLLDGSTCSVTSPRFYDNTTEEFHPVPFDRFFLSEESILVPHWQLVEAHITGVDKLSFPAEKVIDLVDSTGRKYAAGKDFSLSNGLVKWIGASPGMDPSTNKGRIYSIRYLYRPHWYVGTMSHQIRVAAVDNLLTGVRESIRMPQAMVLHREHVFLKEQNDPDAPQTDPSRQEMGPAVGSFGPR